jgi:hypothetical protein
MDQRGEQPIIGSDLPWHVIEAETLLVTGFTPFANVEAGQKVAGPPAPLPYGSLTVESPILNQLTQLPVTHRVDFLNLWDIQRGGAVDHNHRLVVSYLPYRGFLRIVTLPFGSGFFPVIRFRIVPQATVREIFASLPRDPDERHKQTRSFFIPPRYCLTCGNRLWGFATRCDRCQTPASLLIAEKQTARGRWAVEVENGQQRTRQLARELLAQLQEGGPSDPHARRSYGSGGDTASED